MLGGLVACVRTSPAMLTLLLVNARDASDLCVTFFLKEILVRAIRELGYWKVATELHEFSLYH